MLVDVKSFSSGVDTVTDQELLGRSENGLVYTAVNRSFRGGVNRTRPPFKVMLHTYEDDEAKTALEDNAISGVFGYRKKKTGKIPTLIAAAGEYILAGKVYANTIRWRVIYKGINMSVERSYFCQAEHILIWGNGIDENLYWDGDMNQMDLVSNAIEGVNGAKVMPVIGPMVYAHGRIFGSNPDNVVFASNHIYSAGFVDIQKGILNFSESTYPASGDGFGTPGDLDEVTGISVVRQSAQINGHGPVIVFCRNGAYAIGADIPRSEWTSTRNIQTIVITGRGCIGPFSTVQINSDIWYRCSDGSISSFKSSYSDFSSQLSDTPASRGVQGYLEFDAMSSAESSFGIHFDNRLIMSCAMVRSTRSNGQIDRYAQGFVVADFYKPSDPYNVSWDGIWTGLRAVGACKLQIDSMERAFFFSFDQDGKNRVYELTKEIGDDLSESGPSPIEWSFGNSFFFKPEDYFKSKRIIGSIIYFDNAVDGLEMDVKFAPDTYDSLISMKQKKDQSPNVCHTYEKENCANDIYGRLYGVSSFIADCTKEFVAGSRMTANYGNSFRLVVSGKGSVDIRKQLLIAEECATISLEKTSSCCGKTSRRSGCSEVDMIFNYFIQK